MAQPVPQDQAKAANAAFSFAKRIAPATLFQRWTFVCGRGQVSFAAESNDAYTWLLKNIRSISGVLLSVKGLQYTNFIAVETHRDNIRAFPPRAMAAVQSGNNVAFLWRIQNEADLAKADLLAAIAIERLGGYNLNYLYPLPGSIRHGSTVTILRCDPSCISRPTQFKSAADVKKIATDPDERQGEEIVAILKAYGIKCTLASVVRGPTVLTIEVTPERGTPGSKITERAADIAREMSVDSAFVMPSTGRNTIGIQIPNKKRETVLFSGLIESAAYRNGGTLPLILGKDVAGEPLVVDLQKMPHLMIAGTTGSGKSVGVKTMILSLAHRLLPAELGFVLIDAAKRGSEFSVFGALPHLVGPVVTTPERAVKALEWVIAEMNARYDAMERAGSVNIGDYNARAAAGQRMPYFVVVIDEFADLMLTASEEVEAAVQRIAQLARAVGIHLIMATQRPSVDVVTGVIKANFPTRISYRVVAPQDSVTILNKKGAEALLDEGDGIWLRPGGHMTRFQGSFAGTDEIRASVASIARGGARRPAIFAAAALPPEPARRVALAAPAGEAIVETVEDLVLRALCMNGPMTTARLTQFAGVNRQKLHRMETAGLIESAQSGRETRWRLRAPIIRAQA